MKIDRVSPLFRGIGIGPMIIPFLSLRGIGHRVNPFFSCRGLGSGIGLFHFYVVELGIGMQNQISA